MYLKYLMLIIGNDTYLEKWEKCFVHSNCLVFTVGVGECASVTQAE